MTGVRLVAADRVRLDGPPPAYAPRALVVDGASLRDVLVVPEGRGARAHALREAAARTGAGRVDDFGAAAITPAFVNAHTHLALAFLRGPGLERAARDDLVESYFFAAEARLERGDVRAFARMGAYESVLAGVGHVWDHYYRASEVAEALVDAGLTGVVAPTLQDLGGPGGGAGAAAAALEETEALDARADLRGRGVFAAVGPHATDTVSAALWRDALALAERRGLPVHAHLAQSAAEVARVRAREGVEPLPWLARLGVLDRAPALVLAHALYARRAHLARLDPARHALAFCPSAQAVFGFPAPARAWAAAGVPWVVATDAAAGNDSMSIQKELRLAAAARTADLTGSAAFARHFDGEDADGTAAAVHAHRTAALDAAPWLARPADVLALALGRPGRLDARAPAGTLAPGALANLVVWDLEHPAFWPLDDVDRALALGDTTGAIHAVVLAGRDVGTPGDFARSVVRSPEYREARREADARLARLRARLPPGPG